MKSNYARVNRVNRKSAGSFTRRWSRRHRSAVGIGGGATFRSFPAVGIELCEPREEPAAIPPAIIDERQAARPRLWLEWLLWQRLHQARRAIAPPTAIHDLVYLAPCVVKTVRDLVVRRSSDDREHFDGVLFIHASNSDRRIRSLPPPAER